MSDLRKIKFMNKKIVMKPQNKGDKGKTEVFTTVTWMDPSLPRDYIIYDGIRYFLQSVNETV